MLEWLRNLISPRKKYVLKASDDEGNVEDIAVFDSLPSQDSVREMLSELRGQGYRYAFLAEVDSSGREKRLWNRKLKTKPAKDPLEHIVEQANKVVEVKEKLDKAFGGSDPATYFANLVANVKVFKELIQTFKPLIAESPPSQPPPQPSSKELQDALAFIYLINTIMRGYGLQPGQLPSMFQTPPAGQPVPQATAPSAQQPVQQGVSEIADTAKSLMQAEIPSREEIEKKGREAEVRAVESLMPCAEIGEKCVEGESDESPG